MSERFGKWCRRMWWQASPITLKRKWLGRYGWATDRSGNRTARQGLIDLSTGESKNLPLKVKFPEDV